MGKEYFYIDIGNASDLKDKKNRLLYRFLEILPGFLAWFTLFLLVFLSWLFPIFVAIFIVLFDVYWLIKTIYLSLHLRAAYSKMKRYLRIDWYKKLEELDLKKVFSKQDKNEPVLKIKDWRDLYHLIIFPRYQEDLNVIEESLKGLCRDSYPLDRMIVVLTFEEGVDLNVKYIVQEIERKFKNKFFRLLIYFHPQNIVGEIKGKGSNIAWAGEKVKKEVIDVLRIPYQNIIVSAFDIDTIVTPGYFYCLTYHYLINPKRTRVSYQPIPFYTNNIWQSPSIARVVAFSATFWHMLQQERPERITTFSSHSMSFVALEKVNFWPRKNVSEDSRIFWRCFLYHNGDYGVCPIYFPVSMDANVSFTFWRTMKNLYKQQRRWGWGVENIPYFLFGFLKNKKIPRSKKLFYAFYITEGFHSWATNALIIFLFGWLPNVLGGEKFNTTVISYNLPLITRTIMTLAMVGLVTSAVLSINLLPPKPPYYGRYKWIWMAVQWLLVPITLIIFGSLPGLEAQTRLMLGKYMGFWVTEKVRISKS